LNYGQSLENFSLLRTHELIGASVRSSLITARTYLFLIFEFNTLTFFFFESMENPFAFSVLVRCESCSADLSDDHFSKGVLCSANTNKTLVKTNFERIRSCLDCHFRSGCTCLDAPQKCSFALCGNSSCKNAICACCRRTFCGEHYAFCKGRIGSKKCHVYNYCDLCHSQSCCDLSEDKYVLNPYPVFLRNMLNPIGE
jgi:hypothetical protein